MNEPYFLAVCEDRPEDPEGFYYTVYFVNNTNHNLENVIYETSGFATFDDELVQTNVHRASLGNVAAHSFVEVETDDEGSFDFVINFTFHFKDGKGKDADQAFTIGKYLSGYLKTHKPLPLLNKKGFAFKSL